MHSAHMEEKVFLDLWNLTRAQLIVIKFCDKKEFYQINNNTDVLSSQVEINLVRHYEPPNPLLILKFQLSTCKIYNYRKCLEICVTFEIETN